VESGLGVLSAWGVATPQATTTRENKVNSNSEATAANLDMLPLAQELLF
jgi:hypothetical protein